jgi:hypothetical protein
MTLTSKLTSKLALAAAGLLLCAVSLAQPSVYFLWKNQAGQTLCNPEAPDASWVKVGGPFEDANCSVTAKQ